MPTFIIKKSKKLNSAKPFKQKHQISKISSVKYASRQKLGGGRKMPRQQDFKQ